MALRTVTRAERNAALYPARLAAFGDTFVGQESFMPTAEILALASAANIGAASRVADLCCGTAGPALFLAETLGCQIVGVDRSPEVIHLARSEANRRNLADHASFVVGDAARPPFATELDAVLLLETMLSIPDKADLLAAVAGILGSRSRFALTLEAGQPMSGEEVGDIFGEEPVWLIPEADFLALLAISGFSMHSLKDRTPVHAEVARRLVTALQSERSSITADIGEAAWHQALTAHATWARWLSTSRVRKLAIVAERI